MNKHIVLIDDDVEEKEIFLAALKKTKKPYRFTYIKYAKEATAQLQKLIPDLVFIDFNMPIMNGLECLKEIKQKKDLQHIPVIIYSTQADSLLPMALQEGAIMCIKKTDSIKVLTEKLSDILII